MKRRHFTLRGQLMFLLIFSLLAMLTVQGYYLIRFSLLTRARERAFYGEVVEQAVDRIRSWQQEIENLAGILASNSLVQEFLTLDPAAQEKRRELYGFIRDNFEEKFLISEIVMSIKLMSVKGELLVSGTSGTEQLRYLYRRIDADYEAFPSPKARPRYTHGYYDPESRLTYFAYIYPVYSMEVFTGQVLGNIIILCRNLPILRYLARLLPWEQAKITLHDGRNIPMAANNPDFRPGKPIAGKPISEAIRGGRESDAIYRYATDGIGHARWKLFLLADSQPLKDETASIVRTGALLGLAILLFSLLICLRIIQNIIAPVKRIVSQLQDVGEDSRYRLKEIERNEIEIIGKEINRMLERIEEANRRVLAAREAQLSATIEKQNAELEALQSQINPHFLYNTLDAIRTMVLIGNKQETAQAIKTLSDLFRYTTQPAEHFISIQQEIDHVRNYLSLLKLRYEERIHTEFAIHRGVLDYKTLKLILQPVVENACYHGILKKAAGGTIRLQVGFQGRDIIFQVEDNGVGFKTDEVEEMVRKSRSSAADPSESIGLANVERRIVLAFGREYGIKLDSQPGRGTAVTVHIPAVAAQ